MKNVFLAPHEGQRRGVNMNLRWPWLTVMVFASIIIVSACTTESTPPPVDSIGTLAQQLASDMLTQTAGAPTPTLLQATVTPSSTDTPTPEPTKSGPIKPPVVKTFAGCWYGPGPDYELDSNIDKGKRVEIVGIGSIPGWYIIINPYFHKRCWIEAANLKIDPAMDLSWLPVMTPMP